MKFFKKIAEGLHSYKDLIIGCLIPSLTLFIVAIDLLLFPPKHRPAYYTLGIVPFSAMACIALYPYIYHYLADKGEIKRSVVKFWLGYVPILILNGIAEYITVSEIVKLWFS